MEHNRKQKILMIIALVASIASLSIGFAAFSTTLSISSNATVTADSANFGVKFSTSKDSLVVSEVTPSSKTTGISTTDGVIDNSGSPTIKGLSATFTNPGQYAEYTFYARNEGEYTAYLNNINFLGNKTCTAETGTTDSLVQSACSYITITATVAGTTYSETTPITGHSLATDSGEEIIVRLEYDSTGPSVDGPFSITFPNVALVYSTIDDSSIQPTITKAVSVESGDINTVGSIVAIGDEKFYVIGQEDGNVKLLSMYNLHVGNQYDDDNGVVALTNPTGIQDSSAIGWFDEYSTDDPIIGTVAFSSTNYWSSSVSSYPSYVYNSSSTTYQYVENYKSYLEGLGASIEDARLISYEELEKLGCSGDDYDCSGAPSWVYATTYWSGSAYGTNDVWFVSSNAYFVYYYYYSDDHRGVRPVIEISTSEF